MKKNSTLTMSVDIALHLHDLNRYCNRIKIDHYVGLQMGERFVHTFFDTPIRYNSTIKNYSKQIRLKMLNIQL